MLPEELQKIFNENDVDDTRIFIDAVDFSKNEPEIIITVVTDNYDGEEDLRQSWLIRIKSYKGGTVLSRFSERLDILADHALLYDYIDRPGSLYFSGYCINPDKLFVDLFSAHLNICGTYIPFTQYLNSGSHFKTILNATSAILATGPKKVLQHYAQCLEKHNLNYKIIWFFVAKALE